MHYHKYGLLPFLVLLLLCSSVFAKGPIRVLEGIVSKVSDGDTVTVTSGGTKLRVRLYGIDAPETEKRNRQTVEVSKQGLPFGEEAFKALEGKVCRKRVKLEVKAIDRYRRVVAVVWLDGRDINREMVAEGWAWAYRQYLRSPYVSEYIAAEEEARAKEHGLWKQANPLPPWEFRKRLRADKRY